MACWKSHEITQQSYDDEIHLVRGFSSHVYYPNKFPIEPYKTISPTSCFTVTSQFVSSSGNICGSACLNYFDIRWCSETNLKDSGLETWLLGRTRNILKLDSPPKMLKVWKDNVKALKVRKYGEPMRLPLHLSSGIASARHRWPGIPLR